MPGGVDDHRRDGVDRAGSWNHCLADRQGPHVHAGGTGGRHIADRNLDGQPLVVAVECDYGSRQLTEIRSRALMGRAPRRIRRQRRNERDYQEPHRDRRVVPCRPGLEEMHAGLPDAGAQDVTQQMHC